MKTLMLVLAAMTLPLAAPAAADPGKGNGNKKEGSYDKRQGSYEKRDGSYDKRGRNTVQVVRVAPGRGDWQDRNGSWHRYGEWQDKNGKWHTNNGRWVRDNNVRNWTRYDYNRPDSDGFYYANRYYRTGSYQPIRVTRQTRIYRGNDDRYYCRRSDGTTGLIVGAAIGGVIGNRIDDGRSSLLGTLLGAGVGAALGQAIDRGSVTCR